MEPDSCKLAIFLTIPAACDKVDKIVGMGVLCQSNSVKPFIYETIHKWFYAKPEQSPYTSEISTFSCTLRFSEGPLQISLSVVLVIRGEGNLGNEPAGIMMPHPYVHI